MVSSDYRKDAREKLSGKWGKAVSIFLVYFAITLVLSFLDTNTKGFLNLIIAIAVAIISVPLSYGLVISFMRLYNGEDVGAFDFFTSGFENFGRSWGVTWQMILKMLLPFILVILSFVLIIIGTGGAALYIGSTSTSSLNDAKIGIISSIGSILGTVAYIWLIMRMYYYRLSQFVAIDNPEKSPKEAVLESKRLMEGKRWKLFCLQFSFIGWAILASISCGIGLLWLMPYIQVATISFYKHALGNTDVVTEAPKENVEG